MTDLGFTPCRADGYVWMRMDVYTLEIGTTTYYGLPAGGCYYEYILIHVYNLMVAIHISEQMIQDIGEI